MEPTTLTADDEAAVSRLLSQGRENFELVLNYDSVLKAREFARFLEDFARIYARLFFYLEVTGASVTPKNIAALAQDARSLLGDREWWGRMTRESEYFHLKVHPLASLRIHRISYNSPMEIGLLCAGGAILLAVILSGGKISTPLLKLELNPLGDGISKLRAALTKKSLRPQRNRSKAALRKGAAKKLPAPKGPK